MKYATEELSETDDFERSSQNPNLEPAVERKNFMAQIYILTKGEGGRHTPIFSNYCPQFHFGTVAVSGTVILPQGKDMCMPGETYELSIELDYLVLMKQGLSFEVSEGGRKVGSGTVLAC